MAVCRSKSVLAVLNSYETVCTSVCGRSIGPDSDCIPPMSLDACRLSIMEMTGSRLPVCGGPTGRISSPMAVYAPAGLPVSDTAQDAGKLISEDQRAEDGCGGIRYSFGGKHTGDTHELRQQQGQWYEQYDLTEQGYEYGDLGLSESYEHILAGALQAEYGHAAHEYGHGPVYGSDECLVAGEGGGHQRREQDHEQYHHEIEGEHDRQYDLETFLYAVFVPVPVIIADNRNKALCKACKRNAHDQHGALHDRQGTDVDVSKLFKTAVQYKAHEALRARHYERRDT